MGNYKVDRIFSEKLSGANTDRPQLRAMLDYVRVRAIRFMLRVSAVWGVLKRTC